MDIDHALRQASDHRAASRLAAAEAIYRQILARYPQHVGALSALAMLLLEMGKIDDATAAYTLLVRAGAPDLDAHLALGLLLHMQGVHSAKRRKSIAVR